jgi:LysR family transcriptional regulator, hydrogen peroxide-inducible genes activator
MDIHHIRYFLAVCETLNFTRAAERCNVTQPALSRAIQQLEEEIGGLLFRRERNLTHPTDLAQLVRPRLQQIVDGLEEARREARRILTMGEANITLGIMCTVGPTRFAGFLTEFQMRFPDISLHLVEGVPHSLMERLDGGEIDLAIMASPAGFPERFEAEPIYQERFLVAFPAGHRFSQLNQVPVGAVDGESYLERTNCEYQQRFSDLMRGCGCDVTIAYESEREDWIQNMVAGGLGICFLPEFSAVIPGLLTRPVCDPEVWRQVSLVSCAAREKSPSVKSFVKAVRTYPWPQSRYQQDAAA